MTTGREGGGEAKEGGRERERGGGGADIRQIDPVTERPSAQTRSARPGSHR